MGQLSSITAKTGPVLNHFSQEQAPIFSAVETHYCLRLVCNTMSLPQSQPQKNNGQFQPKSQTEMA